MDIGTALVALTGIGCATGVVCMLIDKLSGRRLRAIETAKELTEERLVLQQQRVADLELHNRQLQQQLDWHTRLAQGSAPASLPTAAPAEARNGASSRR